MKKILSTIFMVALVFGFMFTVNAATGTITITNNATNTDVTYNAYRMLDLSYDETTSSYAYTINSDWTGFFTEENLGLVTSEVKGGVTYITNITEENAKTLAEKALVYAKSNNVPIAGTTTIAKDLAEGTITVSELGYYLIDSSLGALVHLDTTDSEAKIIDKNGEPTITKEANVTSVSIGDTITYTIEVTVQSGAQNYKVVDNMSKGLTLNEDSFAFTYAGTTPSTNPTPSFTNNNDGSTNFTIDFSNTDLSKVTKITITYTATVNADSVKVDKVNNTATLEYGNNNSYTSEVVSTPLYQFSIKKVNEKNDALEGAKFKLYDAETNGNEIALYYDATNNCYRPVLGTEQAVEIEAGEANIRGLAAGTYYLEETVAPEGYSLLGTRKAVTVSENGETNAIAQDVVNTTGTVLPSTGGMGTVLFVTVGSMMAAAFGLALITKFRMSRIQ